MSTPLPSRLFRTRSFFGRERFGFHYRGRRYTFRTLAQAQRAHTRFATGMRSYRGLMLLIAALLVLCCSAWVVQRSPALQVTLVDQVRSVVGPAPVAFVESQVFRLATLFREARVAAGDTAPSWHVEGALMPTAVSTPHVASTTQVLSPTPLPSAAPTRTATPLPTATPLREVVEVARGGNLRLEPELSEQNVVGWVLPGDQLTILEQGQQELSGWYKVQLLKPGAKSNQRPVETGSIGWISAKLFQAEPPTATPAPTEPILFVPTPAPPTPIATATPVPSPTPAQPEVAPTLAPTMPPPSGDWLLAPLPVVINDGQIPNEGQWQLLPAAADNGLPVMAVTSYRPVAERPDIQAAIVAVDLSRVQLNMVAGVDEPAPDPAAATNPPRTGRIPDEDLGRLLAAFNGGFKALHGGDGMGVGGDVYRPPIADRATVAVLADGSVRIGVWGRDFSDQDQYSLRAWRQNWRLLVENGLVTKTALEGGIGWGASVDKQVETWRTGVGISADGRTLFYAVGDTLTSSSLAEVMRAAGANNAMQLDINNYWARFVTFQRDQNGNLVAQPLISAMPNERKKYLGTEKRDFLYLTVRQ